MSQAARFSAPSGGIPIASDTAHCGQKQILCAPDFCRGFTPTVCANMYTATDLCPASISRLQRKQEIGCTYSFLSSQGFANQYAHLIWATSLWSRKYEERFRRFAAARKRLPHPSRFSKGGYHRPQLRFLGPDHSPSISLRPRHPSTENHRRRKSTQIAEQYPFRSSQARRPVHQK
jgi:hypothetical protein